MQNAGGWRAERAGRAEIGLREEAAQRVDHHVSGEDDGLARDPLAAIAVPYGAPFRMSAVEWSGGAPYQTPALGEHNREVFCDEMGLGHDDLVHLRAAGVV